MKSPIKNQINTIFIHVSDLQSSVQWYCQLLGQKVDITKVAKPVHQIRINAHTGLTLDAGAPSDVPKTIQPSKYPLFNFHTDDIDNAFAFVQSLGYKIEADIIHFSDLSYFTISDPDQNIIMICTG